MFRRKHRKIPFSVPIKNELDNSEKSACIQNKVH